uniref:Uncharacterized protein n=1 Tax=Anopheles dirus TaxID=7168 RepID=A0A182NX89_9DIPT
MISTTMLMTTLNTFMKMEPIVSADTMLMLEVAAYDSDALQ